VSKRPSTLPELVLGPLPVDAINKTIGTELEPGDVVFSRAAQVHAARRHPIEYPLCLPHLAHVICDPLYVGDDHKNPDAIELIGRIHVVNSFVLVAIEMTKDTNGRYNVRTFYPVNKEKVDNRRKRGFLKIAIKAKGPP
jgi:phage-Barnase-EndoU-ColicinE5/D-RelE like nuclease3